MAEMIHFIRQIEAYCQLEVIECSWKALFEFVQKKEGDLDALIESHRVYLDRMVKKILLLSPKAGREENLLNQVRDVFTIILQFREATVSHSRIPGKLFTDIANRMTSITTAFLRLLDETLKRMQNVYGTPRLFFDMS